MVFGSVGGRGVQGRGMKGWIEAGKKSYPFPISFFIPFLQKKGGWMKLFF
jgi:hypothetical protein